MNKCNKTSALPILKQHYTKISFNFIIYSNEKSLSVVNAFSEFVNIEKNGHRYVIQYFHSKDLSFSRAAKTNIAVVYQMR